MLFHKRQLCFSCSNTSSLRQHIGSLVFHLLLYHSLRNHCCKNECHSCIIHLLLGQDRRLMANYLRFVANLQLFLAKGSYFRRAYKAWDIARDEQSVVMARMPGDVKEFVGGVNVTGATLRSLFPSSW